MDYGWPLLTCFLMFVSFWVGKVIGFVHGQDAGYKEGVEQTTPLIVTAVLGWVRQNKDVHISDPEIRDIIKNTMVEWNNKDGKRETRK